MEHSLIGLGSRKAVGKDLVANYLIDQYEFTKLSFADPLRDTAKILFGFTDHQMRDRKLKEQPDQFWRVSPRTALTQIGDAIREKFGEDFLIRRMRSRINDILDKVPTARIVISDVRLQLEAEAIREWGGKLYCIERNTGFSDTHKTETDLEAYNNWAGRIDNNISVPELFEQIDELIGADYES